VLCKRDHDRRHAEEVRDTVLLHGGHHIVHVEPRHDDDGVAALQLPERDDGQAKDVEHGQEAEEHVGTLSLLVLVRRNHRRRRDEVAVRQDDALARPCRARRVQQRGRVALLHQRAAVLRLPHTGDEIGVSCDGGCWSRGGVRTGPVAVEEDGGEAELGDFGQEGGDSDGELGAGVLGLLGDLPGCVERVRGGGDGAEGGDGEEADRVEHAVGGEDEDDVAATHARARGERYGRGVDGGAKLGEGEASARGGVDQCECGRARGGAAAEEVVEGDAWVGGDGRGRAQRAVHAVRAVARGRHRRGRHSVVWCLVESQDSNLLEEIAGVGLSRGAASSPLPLPPPNYSRIAGSGRCVDMELVLTILSVSVLYKTTVITEIFSRKKRKKILIRYVSERVCS
jgi:hypothetical protein